MNKLEQRIFDSLYVFPALSYTEAEDKAKELASMFLELAEKAHGRGYWLGEHNDEGIEGWEDFEEFKQEIL